MLSIRIRTLRDLSGISLRELSRRTGITAANLSLIERGRGNPTLTTLQRIAAGLGVPVVDLLQREEREQTLPARLGHT